MIKYYKSYEKIVKKNIFLPFILAAFYATRIRSSVTMRIRIRPKRIIKSGGLKLDIKPPTWSYYLKWSSMCNDLLG